MKLFSKLILSVIIFSVIILIQGCSAAKPDATIEYLSSERLINKLEANRRKIHSFEGTGSINVKSPSFDNGASFRIIIQKPDSVFLTIYGPFSIELAQILVTKNNFIFYESLKNTAYTGTVSDDLLKNIFKVNLSFNDLIDAFTGGVNLSSRLYKEPTFFDVVQDKYLLTYIDSTKGTISRYTVDVRDLSIVDTKVEDLKGNILIQGSYSGFDLFETVSLPKTIALKQDKEGQYISIGYSGITVNKKNISIDFTVPEDAEIIKW